MKPISLKLVIPIFVGLLCSSLTVPLLCGANQEQTNLTVRQRALEKFDADGDGRLNAVEREAIRKAGSPFAVKRPRFIRDRRRHEQRIKKYDKDGDGEPDYPHKHGPNGEEIKTEGLQDVSPEVEKRARELANKTRAPDVQSYVDEADQDGIGAPESWMSKKSFSKFKSVTYHLYCF